MVSASGRRVSQKKEKMMKKVRVSVIWGIMLYILVLGMSGCNQPGETSAEGARRHQRYMSISKQEMLQDADKLMLTDEPSKLTDKRMP